MFAAFRHRGQRYRRVGDSGAVTGRNTAAFGVHPVQMGQFGCQECSLHLIQTGILPLIYMVVFIVAAVVAQCPHLFGQVRVIGGHTAGIPQRAQVFARVKTEPCGIPQTACTLPLPGGAMGLGRILDDFKPVGRAMVRIASIWAH